jgi:hypothetical protein
MRLLPRDFVMPLVHLTQRDLARRWSMSERTLESWRWKGCGPVYLRLGGRCVYRLEDIEAFETAQLRAKTSGFRARGNDGASR